ncbi:hypothetical protein PROFUN_11208 [Planoprotostelium fungivorum]|uniref:Uncharacterized protein n=1 Tax=Planoprotostelium fungivorum TaxID=1890364 RepID=A0A2P6NAV8_9EUKA|nr:hypothetical protein PROFUN_11208 [Planoprotostelium fungivorum]
MMLARNFEIYNGGFSVEFLRFDISSTPKKILRPPTITDRIATTTSNSALLMTEGLRSRPTSKRKSDNPPGQKYVASLLEIRHVSSWTRSIFSPLILEDSEGNAIYERRPNDSWFWTEEMLVDPFTLECRSRFRAVWYKKDTEIIYNDPQSPHEIRVPLKRKSIWRLDADMEFEGKTYRFITNNMGVRAYRLDEEGKLDRIVMVLTAKDWSDYHVGKLSTVSTVLTDAKDPEALQTLLISATFCILSLK